jgi:hypothetical protein
MAYRALLATAGIVALTLSAGSFSSAQLTDAEMSALENTLFIGNMNLDDLRFERNIYQDRYRLPIIEQAIEDPISAANNLMSLHSSMRGRSLSQSLRIINEQLYDNRPTTPIVAPATAAIERASGGKRPSSSSLPIALRRRKARIDFFHRSLGRRDGQSHI